ncbi:uridine kinase [Streptomyces sp. NPDC090085]|uniref:uridine kinase family protein n=1 Tax=Streptomyces sp. NPDC090085 TaxID=3365943 RepID=UPI003810E73B
MLHGDDYYFRTPKDGEWAPDESGVLRLDVGDPRSLDFTRLAKDADAALGSSPVVIVDGLFARHVTPRTASARFDVFVDLPADLRLARKIQRKCLRDGFPLDVLLLNYLHHRRAAHEQHVEPLRGTCDLVVDGDRPASDLAQHVWTAIAAKDPTYTS